MKQPKTIQKYIVLPVCYLVLNLAEEFIEYKAELIQNEWTRTGVLMLAFVAGIAFLAFLIVPFLEGGLKNLHKESKKVMGLLGEFVFIVLLAAIAYFSYYAVFIKGFGWLLPPELRN